MTEELGMGWGEAGRGEEKEEGDKRA